MACNDPQGWHLVSRVRDFDTTPCFEEGVILSGLLAILLLAATWSSISLSLKPCKSRCYKSKKLLGAKLVRALFESFATTFNLPSKAFLVASLIASSTNLVLILGTRRAVPVLYSYVIEPLALIAAISLTYFHHTRARTSSTVLLLFWPLYTTGLLVWIRTILSSNLEGNRQILALKCIAGGFGLLSFALECFGPEHGDEPSLLDRSHSEHPLLTANIFSIWVSFTDPLFHRLLISFGKRWQTFGWMTPLMKKGASQYITEDDLPLLRPEDESQNLGTELQKALQN